MTHETALVVMHSMRGTPADFEAIFGPLTADLPIRLVLPHGDPHERGGYTWFPPEYYADEAAQVKIVSAAADRLAEEFRDYGRVIVTGASQGGDLAFALAVRHPQLVVAALPMLALYPKEIWPPDGTGIPPIHAFHGEADQIINIEQTRSAIAELQANGVPVTLHTYPEVGHDLPTPMLAQWRSAISDLLTQVS